MEPTPKRNSMNMDTEAAEIDQPNQLLPDDLVLEIVARCGTVGDAIRCAATSKSLRRGILHAPFLRHLHGFLNNGVEHGHDGRPSFIPTLLLGLYRQSGGDPHLPPSFVPVTASASDGGGPKLLPPSLAALPPSAPNHDDDDGAGAGACDFGPYLPVSSRRSLLVLRRRCKSTAKEHLIERHGPHPVELSVCNPTTAERRVLPPHDVQDMSHALLDVDPIAAPSSFRLLVAELSNDNAPTTTLYVQIFSSGSGSDSGGWGPALACTITSRFRESRFKFGCGDGDTAGRRPSPAVVVGDTVYWLCTSRLGDRILVWPWRGGGGAVARKAWIADLPPGYRLAEKDKCLAVLPSPAGAAGAQSSPQASLGLIGIEAGEIEVWACEKSGASSWEWKLWHRIQEATIPRPMGFSSGSWLRGAELSWFCEGSGTLFLRPQDGTRQSPLLFRLGTMEVSKLDAREWEVNPGGQFCPYEVDVLSHMLRDEALLILYQFIIIPAVYAHRTTYKDLQGFLLEETK